ncbi:hypothetical protein B0T21DRAFT_358079 [Apiosordaria backusii]|uniref:Uncharacterized protein n=1 Tax=Apiosordaria backusii TaxID=314023 RepID=A0AA40ESI3_9PEZI|nr:hypothetical protein B0T21DRAFT_358079 [Apiosordaria backusii]
MASHSTTSPHQKLKSTFTRFIHGPIDATTHKNPSLVSSVLSSDCLRFIAPASFLASIGAPPDFAFDVATWEAQYANEAGFIGTKSVDITHLVVDPETKTGAARTVYIDDLNLANGEKEEVRLDVSWFVSFSEDGEKITKVTEVLDGLVFVDVHRRIKELKEESEAKAKGA